MKKIIIGKFDVSREMVETYNRVGEVKALGHSFTMYHQFKDVDGRFKAVNSYGSSSFSLPRNHQLEISGEQFYIRELRGEFWLYWEYRGDVERWLLHDISKAFFDVREV